MPLKVPPIPKGMVDMPSEDGISFNDAKKAIGELSGVSDTVRGQTIKIAQQQRRIAKLKLLITNLTKGKS